MVDLSWLSTLGQVAKSTASVVEPVVSLTTIVDSFFGSGARDRKNLNTMMKQEQSKNLANQSYQKQLLNLATQNAQLNQTLYSHIDELAKTIMATPQSEEERQVYGEALGLYDAILNGKFNPMESETYKPYFDNLTNIFLSAEQDADRKYNADRQSIVDGVPDSPAKTYMLVKLDAGHSDTIRKLRDDAKNKAIELNANVGQELRGKALEYANKFQSNQIAAGQTVAQLYNVPRGSDVGLAQAGLQSGRNYSIEAAMKAAENRTSNLQALGRVAGIEAAKTEKNPIQQVQIQAPATAEPERLGMSDEELAKYKD